MIPLKLSQRISSNMNNSLFILLALINCLLQTNPAKAITHSVQIYRQSSTQLGQLTTSSTLVWESFTNDKSQLEYAIKGGDYMRHDTLIPILVCRATVEGLYVSGHTENRMGKYVCVVSQSNEVKTHHAFDVLVNKEHLGKVTWKPWRKFNAATPVGAVAVSLGSSLLEVTYVARHRNGKHHHHETNEIHGADYNLGRFDPSVGLGKVIVTEHDHEQQFDDGEILVETEPFRYELRKIYIDNSKLSKKINTTELGSAILSNTGDKDSLVDTVISFKYDKVQYWGSYEGVARGLPTKIYDTNVTNNSPDEIKWGLRYSEMRVETKTVSTNLMPGTALNVTLKGNYTSIEAPYTAQLIAYYEGLSEHISRGIQSMVQKATLKDIKLEFSPVYWIENGTFIPTTTTTTTTSTEATTTSTKEPIPIAPPQIHVSSIGSSSSSESQSSSESNDSENEIRQHAQQQQKSKPNNSSSSLIINIHTILLVALISILNSLALLY